MNKLIIGLIALVVAAPAARAEDVIDYTKQIKPVLQARCYACHGVLKQKGGLRLDTAALAIKGGKSGAAITPGDAEASPLIDRVSAADESDRMPPEGEPLKPAEIAALRAWIAQGAKAPADEQPERDPRDHWAFKTPVRPAVPAVENQDVGEESDRCVHRGRAREARLDPAAAGRQACLAAARLARPDRPAADPRGAGRLSSPTTRPRPYDKVVTRLLASPQYGERWGRHWMDIWRYSDWWGLGAEVRNSQKHIWHWRDWIIESLNADKGYDQMLREMLAADELYPTDPGPAAGTGFLARQYFKFNRTAGSTRRSSTRRRRCSG